MLIGLQEKAELFIEISGNLLVRDYTSQLIVTKANELIQFVTDDAYLRSKHGHFFDLSLLKYKERDFLEGIFKFWRLSKTIGGLDPFPAAKCWELRLRSYFGTRYDTRTNCYDWDFAMKLSDRQNAGIVNNRVYAKWRDTGVAFELRESNYDCANSTLASGMVFNDPRSGDKTSRRG